MCEKKKKKKKKQPTTKVIISNIMSAISEQPIAILLMSQMTQSTLHSILKADRLSQSIKHCPQEQLN